MEAKSSSAPFRNLIRFLDESSNEHYGDLSADSLNNIVGSTVSTLQGNLFDLQPSKETAVVHKLLSPIPSTPLFVCVGLNYRDHAKEANLDVPPNPVIFMKPAGKLQIETPTRQNFADYPCLGLDALTGSDHDVDIPEEAKLMDYEGELCIIISKTGKNIPEEEVRHHIFGFTVGNDLSSRYWQRPPRSGGQFSFAKSFDGFAPLGPTILHASYVDAATTLEIETKVNGETRQKATNYDMIFSVEQIVSHISKGTTLRQGTVIMTGTPAGIAAKWKGGTWLQDGDVVEIEISGIGRLRNKLVFQKSD